MFGKKRIVKIVITLLVFSVIYYCADTYLNNVEVDLGTFAKQLYSANLKYHLWYLYAYIAFLMSSPFLRNMVKNLENKYFYYMIGISIFLNLLRFVEYFIWKGQLGINVWLKTPWMVGTIVIYPCVGYFVEHRVSVDVLSRKIPFMWLITILGNALSCYATYFMGTVSGDFTSQAFHESFSLVNCITIYLTVKYIFSYVKLKPVLERSICSLGACTFGIYLLHPLIKDTKIFLKLQGMIAGTGMNAMAAIWIFILTVVICCWIVTWVLRRIPGVRYVIGG